MRQGSLTPIKTPPALDLTAAITDERDPYGGVKRTARTMPSNCVRGYPRSICAFLFILVIWTADLVLCAYLAPRTWLSRRAA